MANTPFAALAATLPGPVPTHPSTHLVPSHMCTRVSRPPTPGGPAPLMPRRKYRMPGRESSSPPLFPPPPPWMDLSAGHRGDRRARILAAAQRHQLLRGRGRVCRLRNPHGAGTHNAHTQYWPGHHAPPCAGRPRPLICAGARTHTRQGRIIYLGYDYSEPVTPWVHALVAASMFNDYDFKGPPPVTASSSVK